MDVNIYGVVALGLVVGFGLGELLEEVGKKTAKLIGTLVVGLLNLAIDMTTQAPDFLPLLGWGVVAGIVVSIFTEPGPFRWCYRCVTRGRTAPPSSKRKAPRR